MKSKFFRVTLALSLLLCLCAMALADTIRLKDGSVIKGKIISFRDGQFVVSIGDGARSRQMTFFADEVEAVEFDSLPLGATTTNPIKLTSPTTQNPRPQATPANNPTIPANTNTNNAGLNSNNNTNVIIVGKSNTNSQPTNSGGGANNDSNVNTAPSYTNSTPTNPTPTGNVNANTIPVSTNTNPSTTRPKPIQLNVKVLADNTANGWTNSGFHVKKGQKFRVSGRGQISLGNGNFAKPEGIKSLADDKKLLPSEATGGLLAVIGDDNNDFIFIGASREFTATRDGMLFLGINENNLNDNSGSFEVTIEIEPIN
ncbi:MAG TPA: hypothetical protein VGB68_13945 [Pyrinomonadaceae bacterium]